MEVEVDDKLVGNKLALYARSEDQSHKVDKKANDLQQKVGSKKN